MDVKVIYLNIICVWCFKEMVKFRIVLYFIKWFIQHQQLHEQEDPLKNEELVNQVVRKVNVSLSDRVFIKSWIINLVTQSTSTITDYEDQLDRQTRDLISIIHKAYKETVEVKFQIKTKLSRSFFISW